MTDPAAADPDLENGQAAETLEQLLGLSEPASDVEASIPPDEAPGTSSLSTRAERLHKLRMDDHELDHTLKKRLGHFAIVVMVAQLVVADGIFVVYAYQAGWDLDAPVMVAWLSAAVVQVVGVVLVIAKYLFPQSGNPWNSEPSG